MWYRMYCNKIITKHQFTIYNRKRMINKRMLFGVPPNQGVNTRFRIKFIAFQFFNTIADSFSVYASAKIAGNVVNVHDCAPLCCVFLLQCITYILFRTIQACFQKIFNLFFDNRKIQLFSRFIAILTWLYEKYVLLRACTLYRTASKIKIDTCFIPNNTNVFRLSGGIISQNAMWLWWFCATFSWFALEITGKSAYIYMLRGGVWISVNHLQWCKYKSVGGGM